MRFTGPRTRQIVAPLLRLKHPLEAGRAIFGELIDEHGGEKIDLQVGNNYQMKIIKLSPQERKIGLSIRAMKSDDYRSDWEAYAESEGTGTATLGDHFRNR